MKVIAIFLFATILSFSVHSQPTKWINHTDMKQVNSIQASENGVWAASSGGGYFYDISQDSYLKITKTDGLFSTTLTAVCIDDYGKIWFGSSVGSLNYYDPSTQSTRTFLDIYNSDRVNKNINELRTTGDTIFISTESGLSLIDSKSLIFYDTYSKFGNLGSFLRVSSTFKHNLIYACTDFGVAVQKPGATNLSAPESWNVYTTANGLPSNTVRKVELFRDTIIAATDKGISFFNGTTWQTFLTNFNNISIIDMIASNDSLIISHGNSLSVYYQGSLSKIFSSTFEFRKIASSKAGLFATSSAGVLKVNEGNNYQFLVPNGPAANQFPNLTTDGLGNLWSASGTNGRGKGIYKFDGSRWDVYDAANYPAIFQNDYYSIFSASDNSVYAGNWGQGFVRISGSDIIRYHSGNTIMKGIPQDPNFLVISGLSQDSRNNIWILNLRASDRKSLYMLSPDSIWYAFENTFEQQAQFSEVKNLAIDQNGTKWYSMASPGSSGLFYYNEKGTYSAISDDLFGYITKSNGLNDNTINCIVPDKRGDLWIGTSLGVNVISNTSNLTQLRISSVFSLRQQTINCIAVDALNQKWIGTNQGLLQVNSDGSVLIASYDSQNSPLLSDEIKSLAIDNNNGIVYVGTDNGLISFETPAIKPLDNFTELFVYPNPLLINGHSTHLTIDGLIKDAEIKILSVNGKLIREFPSPGGRVAYWDGKDLSGNFVSSGIYIVTAFDQDGNNVAATKVAVLKNK
jgi:streptogramin lyase